MTPSISTTFKGEEEKYTNKVFTIDFMGFAEMKKIKKCAWLQIFCPHHQNLTRTSDREAHRGVIVDSGRNERNTPRAQFVYDPFSKRFK